MEEKNLIDIEARLDAYPLEARQDIVQLVRELRRVKAAPSGKGAQQATAHLYDPLTGLLNAGAYGVRFAMARARATRYRKIFAVMSLDVDPAALAEGGNEAGRDDAIKEIAGRLEGCVRATDTLARIGEENFAIILEDLTQPGHAERVKQHVQEVLAGTTGRAASPVAPTVEVRLQYYPGPDPAAGNRLSS